MIHDPLENNDVRLENYLAGFGAGANDERVYQLTTRPADFQRGYAAVAAVRRVYEQIERESLFGAPLCPDCHKLHCLGHD